MTGSRRRSIVLALLLAAAGWSAHPAGALGQDAPVDAEADEAGVGDADVEEVEAAGSDVDPASVASAPEELPDGADLGPPLSERPPILTPEEQRRERLRNYDPSEPQHPLALQIHIGLGGALGSSLDDALRAHRYGDSPIVFQGDVALLARITEWLYVGGRLGGRGRGWLSNEVSAASAGGVDGMAIAHARVYLGRVVDLGAILGAGIGWGGISLDRGGAAAVAPRLHGSALVAFRLGEGARLCARFAWDWFSLYDLDRYGSDLELGGPSLALGLEIRR